MRYRNFIINTILINILGFLFGSLCAAVPLAVVLAFFAAFIDPNGSGNACPYISHLFADGRLGYIGCWASIGAITGVALMIWTVVVVAPAITAVLLYIRHLTKRSTD